MLVIVPACGRGERFKKLGYAALKPLVAVDGEPMVDRVISALNLEAQDKYFIVRNWDGPLTHPSVVLERATVGATETVLLALDRISYESDESLLIIDCDAIYHCDVIALFRSLEQKPECRAGVLCFPESAEHANTPPKFSYTKVDTLGTVLDMAEKLRVGPLANTGAYWFANVNEFKGHAQSIIDRMEYQVGEAYISCVLKKYIEAGLTMEAVEIQEAEYSNVGTPACLDKYLRNQRHAFLFDLDGTLVETTQAYVRAWHDLLRGKGAYVDEAFFQAEISGLSDVQVMNKFKFSISSSQKDELFLSNISLVKEIQGASSFVRECQRIGQVAIVTNSNKCAAIALLKQLGLDDIHLISAQDVEAGKPDPEPYSLAMRQLGVSPSKCLVFEDSQGGLISGRAAMSKYVIAVSNKLAGCDAFLQHYSETTPEELLQTLESVAHLTDELSVMLGRQATVYPVRASGGYISEILSASSGSRKMIIKQENPDHGVLQDVSEKLDLHNTECAFYETLARTSRIRLPMCYGILPLSRAIVMEDLRRYERAPDFNIESGLKVVKAIASHHSHFRGAPLGILDKPKTYMKVHVLQNYARFKEKWSSSIPLSTLQLFDHAVSNYEVAERQLLSQPRTLLHGDLKFPNLFWDPSSNGGEPVFIDWQYAAPGKGIEDIVFLLVESCTPVQFEQLSRVLIHAYYDEIHRLDGIEYPPQARACQVSCALAGFPLFVAVWFGCIDASKLSDRNFPFLYILRLANAFDKLYDEEWVSHMM